MKNYGSLIRVFLGELKGQVWVIDFLFSDTFVGGLSPSEGGNSVKKSLNTKF